MQMLLLRVNNKNLKTNNNVNKKYEIERLIGLDELIPTLVFCTIASEIKIGFINYREE